MLTQLQRYQPTDPHERTMWLDTIAFVEKYPDCFERSLSVGHVTGSAWIVAPNPTQPGQLQVVLIHHRKLDRWFQPGGHADGNPDILAVARQEAHEETGLTQLTTLGSANQIPEIFDVDVHLIPARGAEPAHFHYDIRYLFKANPLEPFVHSGETKAICWVDLQDIIRYTTEESIERMVKKTRNLTYLSEKI
ncbi:NUDIX domain-containing protein [Rudanella paleaurantiibacter]|uniref:NUDIX domain-containing protein n=1 Tax=Rudanella paleaurantiibacter TaxID=2614655 RepID=A0A7J5TW70_9BACT|nr:NUDIX domain-containing protein [Rudanella paleaurantiibacter]